jgi:hypothetical protein
MDVLYYSNFCPHSKKTVQFLAKNNLMDRISFICIDKRKVDDNGQTTVFLENGTQLLLPPNIHNVPSLMLVKQNYRIVTGNEILSEYASHIKTQMHEATSGEGEPTGFSFTANNPDRIVSEKFTAYQATPADLSTKGQSSEFRPLHHYVSAMGDGKTIKTPPDSYRPNKVSESVTVDSLQKARNDDLAKRYSASPFLPK